MARIREGDVLSQHLEITVEEITSMFITVESRHVNAEVHEVLWHKGYTFVGPVTEVVSGLYHSTFRKTHMS